MIKYYNEIFSYTVLVTIVLVIVSTFTSCGLIASKNEEQQVESKEKMILDAINTRDVSSIKGMFSKSALTQISDIDEKINEFLTFYSGKYVSSKYSYSIGDDVENGNDQKSIYLTITVTTDKDSFVIACTDVISNPKDSDKIGVCQLEIIHEADAESSVAWHSGSQNTPAVECFN